MRKNLLISVATAALLAGTALAAAQGARPGNDLPGGNMPSAAPAEKMDQGTRPGSRGDMNDLKGTRSGAEKSAPAGDRKAQSPAPSTTTGQAPGDTKKGQATERGDSTKGQTQMDRSKDQPRTGQSDSKQPAAQGQRQQQTGQSEQKAGAGASTSASLSTEQRTRIRETVIKSGNAPRVSRSEINFNINVGTAVPRSVRLVTVPTTVVEIYPAWRGFLYFVVEDEIVIVEPGSLRIVAVIPA
jgi:hypothetical protein